MAWPRVAPKVEERTVWGEEALGLAAARAAVAKAKGTPTEFQILDTLAWALVANGQDAEAKQASGDALEDAPDHEQAAFAGYQRDLGVAIEQAASAVGDGGAALAELTTVVSERRTFRLFPATADGEAAAVPARHVGGVAGQARVVGAARRRQRWTSGCRGRSRSRNSRSRIRRLARRGRRCAAAIADDVVASKLARGSRAPLPDEAVIGLVPIGMNPVTKLWEFYELRSAWDGKARSTHDPDPFARARWLDQGHGRDGDRVRAAAGRHVHDGRAEGDQGRAELRPQSRNDERRRTR